MEKGGLTVRERMSIERMMGGAVERGEKAGRGVGGRGGQSPEGREEKLYGSLNTFAAQTEKFVFAVGSSVAAMQGRGEELQATLKQIQSATSVQAPKE